MLRGRSQSGFTIVELLIVVVVIAILAAITIVAYNGIQNRAKNSAALNATAQVSKKVAYWQVENPSQTPPDLDTVGVSLGGSSTSEYSPGSNGVWCATITTNSISYYVSNTTSTPTAGGCAGHAVNGIAAITNYATNPHAVTGGTVWGNQTPSGGVKGYIATGAQDGGSTYQVQSTSAGQFRIAIPMSVGAVNTGDVISVGVDVYSSVVTQAQIEIGISGLFPKSTNASLGVGWNRIERSVTMPTSGTVGLVQILGTDANLPSGTVWSATRAMITKSTSPYTYSDGNTSNWVWNGTANSSTSKGIAL